MLAIIACTARSPVYRARDTREATLFPAPNAG